MLPKKSPSADIKAKTRRYFETSMLAALLLVVSAFQYFPDVSREVVQLETQQEVIQLDDVVNTRQETRPPPPPRPAIPIEVPDAEAAPDIDLSTEMIPEDMAPAPRELPPASNADKKLPEEDMYFEAVEDPPELIGGLDAVLEHLVYPELAKRAGIEGTVVVKAYVGKSGEVARTEIMRGIGGGCDESAAEAVRQVRFKPGMQRGVPVNVKVAIPVKFKLTTAS